MERDKFSSCSMEEYYFVIIYVEKHAVCEISQCSKILFPAIGWNYYI